MHGHHLSFPPDTMLGPHQPPTTAPSSHSLSPRHWTLVGHEHALNGEMQQTGHVIKCHYLLPRWKMEARCLLVTSLNKGRTQPVVNLTVVGILQPLKTGGSQVILKPLCCHPSHVFFIMYRHNLLPVVYTF